MPDRFAASTSTDSAWVLEMFATSTEEPMHLAQTLVRAVAAGGGWVLSHVVNDTGEISTVFEFERQTCVNMYCSLIATGIELSQRGHEQLTELCQCACSQQKDFGLDVACIELSVRTATPSPRITPPGNFGQ